MFAPLGGVSVNRQALPIACVGVAGTSGQSTVPVGGLAVGAIPGAPGRVGSQTKVQVLDQRPVRVPSVDWASQVN